MSNCNCKDWQEGHKQIVAAWAFCANHGGGPIYTGPIGRFCHWCGERLGEDEERRMTTRDLRRALLVLRQAKLLDLRHVYGETQSLWDAKDVVAISLCKVKR